MRKTALSCLLLVLGGGITGAEAHRAVALDAGEKIVIDGRLDDAAWRRAPAHNTFQQQDPFTGKPAPFETRIHYAFGKDALYIAVHALDPEPRNIRAPFVRHDKVFRDQDFVVAYVDAVGSKASAQWFRVNARGAKADGVHTTANDSEDFSPDFDWDAAAAIVADGYTVEMRIPFSTLRFTHGGKAQWRTMVARRMPRERTYLFLSVPLRREDQSFIAALAPIEGFAGTNTEFAWTARPNVTARRLTESPDDPATKRHKLEAGLDLKVRPRADWVIDATLNPDFSQIELDTPQLSRNTQFALFFQEKRPFFLEGSDLAQMSTDALYSRSIADPRWGLRATYRGDTLAATALTVRDAGGGLVLLPGPYATSFAAQPRSHATTSRVRWEVPGAPGLLSVGAIASDRRYENADGSDAGFNRVAGPDMVWQFSDSDRMRAQWLGAATSAFFDPAQPRGGPERNGALAIIDYNRQTEISNGYLRLRHVGENFRNDNGFLSQSGFRSVNGNINRMWRRDAALHEITPFFNGARGEALADGRTIATESALGLYVAGPRGSDGEIQYRRNALRVNPFGPLHDLRQVYLRLAANPNSVLTQLNAEIERGERVDIADDLRRPSLFWNLSGRVRLGDRIEFEPLITRLALDGGSNAVLTETVAQLLAVGHFTSRDTLRLIVQRIDADRRADPSSPTPASEFRTTVGSLVYSHRQSIANILYLGVTRGRERVGSLATATEIFAKLQFGV
jgi:hypothetical protein